MYKVVLIVLISTLFCSKSKAQFNHSGRGMYVDKFFRTALTTNGSTVINPVFSILGIPSKEDSLLKYAKENHFTYLILYDLRFILGNSTYEDYLCSFIQKAKNQYCIEYIGAPSSCASMFSDIFGLSSTPAISLSDVNYADSYSQESKEKLRFVEEVHEPGDSLFFEAEFVKLAMRAAAFNDNCSGKFDLLVSEYEFWNAAVDDCIGDNPTRDVRYQRYQTLITNMDIVRDNYNISHANHQIYVETYLGYLHQNTNYTHQQIADWIDGTYSGKRRVDRISAHYYGQDPSRLYSRTSSGQNQSGYYTTRFLDFCQSSTTNQTYLRPLFSSEYIPWGSSGNFLGAWFSQNVNNNIFTAEKPFYDDWIDDAANYHQSTVGSPTLGTVVHPGGVQWFSASRLVGHLNNPVMFTSNSPVCVSSGQNGTLQFQYQGPIEQGSSYKFYITNAGNSTVRCGSTSSITWPAYNTATGTSINLNTALGSCSLPAGEYDAHLELTYAAGCSAYVAPLVRVSIVNTGKIVALTPTTVCQGNPVYLQASSTGGGTTTYAWYDGSSAISGATSSTYAPSASSVGNHNYSCLITSSVGGCSANRSNVIPVTINAYPDATVTTQSTSACSVTLQANPTGGTYLWHNSSTGSTYSTSYSGIYAVAVTVNGCTSLSPKYTVSNLAGSGTVAPAVSIASNTTTTVCSGSSTVFTATPTNGGSTPTYQWKKNGNNVGSGLITYTTSTLANNDVITCVMTSNLSCASPLNATSNSLTITVNQNLTPTVTISSGSGSSICSGTNVVFTATPVNGGPIPAYQWTKNSVNVGANSNTYTDNALANSDVIRCIVTSSLSCVTSPTATSSAITMTVNPVVAPSLTISSNQSNPICSGTSVIFTPNAVNGGAAPSYQWKRNGTNAGTGTTYTSSSLQNNDIVSCVVTTNAPCASPATATSNNITMTVNTVVAPTISVSSSQGTTICSGTNVTFTTSITNGGSTPTYQWKKNGTNTGSNNSQYSSSTLSDNDVITCMLTSNAACATPASVTSNSVSMDVATVVIPSLSISTIQPSPVCSGSNVTFNAIATNEGSSPSYQWKKNGVNVGNNSSSYTINSLTSSDIIRCVLTSNAGCANPTTATSNNISMTVLPVLAPSVTVSPNPGTNVCTGSNVTFTAIPINGGVTPVFNWRVNGYGIGSSGATYSNSNLSDNDIVSCVMTSDVSCAFPLSVTSNGVLMTVSQPETSSVSISSSNGNTICPNTDVLFTATMVNAGSAPVFQWKKNGNNVGFNSIYYTDNSIVDGDVVKCVMTGNAPCVSPLVVTSNEITMSIVSSLVPSVSILSTNYGNTICERGVVTFTASGVNGGSSPTYQWIKNGSIVGTNSITYTDNTFLNSDQVYCMMTSSVVCSALNPAISNIISLDVVSCNPVQLNLKVFIQGYYKGNSQMNAVVDPVQYPLLCDTLTAELRYANAPYGLLYSITETVNTNGNASFVFPAVALSQHYFVALRHRNALETWSTSIYFNSAIVNYDFSDAASKAYGSNQISLGDGNFALWSGDVTDGPTPGVQDGIINNLDRLEIEKAATLFVSGYVVDDINGDRLIESSDFSLLENNETINIIVSRP